MWTERSGTDKNGGWGHVIRDESGEVIQSGSGRVPFAINPLQMELTASIEGVKAATSLASTTLS
jgi:ribonuclease HI